MPSSRRRRRAASGEAVGSVAGHQQLRDADHATRIQRSTAGDDRDYGQPASETSERVDDAIGWAGHRWISDDRRQGTVEIGQQPGRRLGQRLAGQRQRAIQRSIGPAARLGHVKRLSSWALPIILGLAGAALIIVGTVGIGEEPVASLPPIARPSPTVVPTSTATPEASASATDVPSPSTEPTETPLPTPTPLPESVTAVQMEIRSVGINIVVRHSQSAETDSFPPVDAAYILRNSSQPGRNTNSYVFAHALNTLFKPLWNVQVGAEVLVRMSDDSVLRYVVTEVRPNVP